MLEFGGNLHKENQAAPNHSRQEEDAGHYVDKSVADRIPSSGEIHLLPSWQTKVYVLIKGGASCEPAPA